MRNITIKITSTPLLLLFFVFSGYYGMSQSASTYNFTATTATYSNLTGTTNVGGLNNTSDDVLSNATNIGFTFNFAGTNYTQFKACSNGFITFNTSSTDTFYDNTEANAGTSKPVLMPLWDDLQSTARVRYLLDGTSPNRILKIEYRGNEWNYNAGGDAIKFQVWLYETSNRIEYRYQRSATGLNSPSATIGIYDASGTYLTLDGSGSSPSASSTTFTTSISAKPANDQVFRFDPPTNPIITSSVASLSQFTACNLTASASQSFVVSGILLTANILITAPTGFEVSTDNVNFFDTRTLTKTGSTVAATTVYARMKSLSSNPTAGNIAITSTGAVTRTISVSGLLISPTGVSAGSDVAVCASSTVNLDGSVTIVSSTQTLSSINDTDGFTTLTTNDLDRWGISASANAGGSANELRMQYFTGSNPTPVTAFVQSPLLDATAYTALSMTFKHNLDWFAGTAPLFLQTSTDGTTWTTRWNLNATGNVAANTVTVDLTSMNNTSFYYRFLYDGNIYNIDYWYIDDIVITGTYTVPVTYSWTSSPSGFTSSIQDPTVSPTVTTTYTLAVTSNGCTVTDDVVVTIGSTTWNGTSWDNGAPTSTTAAIMTGNYTSSSSLNACSLTVTNNSTVIISSGDSVALNGALTVDAGSSFTLENNANLLQNGSSNQNSGSITVKRYSSALKRQDYTLWSSPVAGQQLQSFSPGTLSNRFYTYDTSADQYAAVATPSATNFATATGYLIRMPNVYPTTATVWTDGAFVGVPNSGDYNFTMVDGGSGLRFNLVGNPYPSPIDAADFVGNTTNATNTTGTLYFWRKTNNAASPSYCTWTTGGFVSNGEAEVYDPNGVIQTGQGFFVEGTGSGTTVAFNNTMRTDNHANQFFRTSSEVERHRIWLNATGADGLFSQTMVGYMSDATNGYDATIDGKYINDGSIALTSLIDATPYAIQGRSMPFDAADIVPMQFKAATAGTFSIAIDHVDGLFNGSQDIYLRDTQTGMDHDLKASAYTFSSEAGTFDTRFKLVYTAALSVDHPTLDANTIVIYKNENQSFTINSGAIAMASIKVFDIRGRMITTQNNINTTQATITAGQTNQVLLVQVTSVDGATVTKKVVR